MVLQIGVVKLPDPEIALKETLPVGAVVVVPVTVAVQVVGALTGTTFGEQVTQVEVDASVLERLKLPKTT
jgi:hypothetical protein